MGQGELSVFVSYAREDENLRKELDKHLSLLKHQKLIDVWHDRNILAAYIEAVNLRPENSDIYRSIGLVLEQLGRYDEALSAYEQVLYLDATDYVNKGNILCKLGAYEEALDSYEMALHIDPNYKVHCNHHTYFPC
jgi:tetratricopeptide (TPR) repeat protein